MYQLGIFNISQLISILNKGGNKRNQPVAIDLYTQINELDPEKQEQSEEIILENFSFSDGSYKKTHSGRFDEFDEKIINRLKDSFGTERKLLVHDLAVSDGRTSFDFFSKLQKIFSNLDFFASDKNMFAYVQTSFKNEERKMVTDEAGKILQIIFPPFVLNFYSSKRAWRFKIKRAILYPINFIIINLFKAAFVRNIFFKAGGEKKKITLLQNKTIDLTRSKNNFHIQGYDLFQENPDKFDIIRAMNVVNLSYFTAKEIRKIAYNILNSLKEGGLFVVGSNKAAATPVNGDLFIKKNGRLESLEKFGDGAPFREIILSI
jgi:hypothetical protein